MSTKSQIPFEIAANDAINGIAKVSISPNWSLMPSKIRRNPDINDLIEFELQYRYIFNKNNSDIILWNEVNDNTNDNSININKSLFFHRQITNKLIKDIKKGNDIDIQQNVIHFNLTSFRGKSIFIRVPSSISHYKIECKLRYFVDTKHNYFSDWSEPFYIDVNSSLIYINNFKVGDKVTYRPPNISLQTSGEILKIKSNEEQENEITIRNRDNEIITVGQSRVVAQDINAANVIDITTFQYLQEMYKHLCIKSKIDDDECFNLFLCLYDIYLKYAILYDGNDYFTKHHSWKWLTEYINLTEFVCFNIIEYIYSLNGYKWRLQCILNQNDKLMIEWNLMRFIYTKYFIKIKENYELYKTYDPNGRYFTCDLCRIQILSWDIMYRCEEKACDSHNICKYCSFNMILTNTQINNLLLSLLKHELNYDCVCQISAFVAGNVIKINKLK